MAEWFKKWVYALMLLVGLSSVWSTDSLAAYEADGWSLAAGFQSNNIDGNNTFLSGVSVQHQLGSQARIGLEAWSSVADVSLHYGRYNQLGGGFTYLYQPGEEVTVYNELFVGAGSLLRKANPFSQYQDVRDRFVVMEPGLGLEMALSPSLSLKTGFRYRWVTKVDILGTEDSDLYGFSVNAVLRWQPGTKDDFSRSEKPDDSGGLDTHLKWPDEIY